MIRKIEIQKIILDNLILKYLLKKFKKFNKYIINIKVLKKELKRNFTKKMVTFIV